MSDHSEIGKRDRASWCPNPWKPCATPICSLEQPACIAATRREADEIDRRNGGRGFAAAVREAIAPAPRSWPAASVT